MSKPIGYYTSYTPGQQGLLTDMQDTWGPSLEKLNESEKAWLIWQLGYLLWKDADGETGETVSIVVQRATSELSNLDKLGLIEAMVHGIKND